MKVIATELKRVEKELDLEYPYYLYYQNEDCISSEVIKVYPDCEIILRRDYMGMQIETKKHPQYAEYQILQNQTTEEHFNTEFEEILGYIEQIKLGNK